MAHGLGFMRGVLMKLAAFLDSNAAPPAPPPGVYGSGKNTITLDPVTTPAQGESKLTAEAAQAAFIKGLGDDVSRAFDAAMDPETGEPWTPRKFDYDHSMLVKSGTMRAAAIGAAQNAGRTPFGVEVDLTDPAYGFFQQNGTARIDPRQFLAASPDTWAKTTGVVMDVVNKLTIEWGQR